MAKDKGIYRFQAILHWGGVLRIIDHPFKNLVLIDLLTATPNSFYNCGNYIALVKTLNLNDSLPEYASNTVLLKNVLVSVDKSGRFVGTDHSKNDPYEILAHFYGYFGFKSKADMQQYVTVKNYYFLSSGYNNFFIVTISKYPDEEQGTIYNSGDGRFWNNKMLYVTNTGNLIS